MLPSASVLQTMLASSPASPVLQTMLLSSSVLQTMLPSASQVLQTMLLSWSVLQTMLAWRAAPKMTEPPAGVASAPHG
jgi:hypothetical protein